MKAVFESRASMILYNFLVANGNDKKFILPFNVCPIVPAVFLKAKQEFILLDINDYSLSIDQENVIELIKKHPNKYTGLLFLHPYGALLDIEHFYKEIKAIQPDFLLIDDRCLCRPTFEIEPTEADLVLYSTGYSKYIDLGWGGYAFINKERNYSSLNLKFNAINHDVLVAEFTACLNQNKKFIYKDSDWLGGTKLMDFLSYQKKVNSLLKKVDQHKKKLNKYYSENLPREYQLKEEYNNWRFNLLIPESTIILETIFNEGLFASKHYQSLKSVFGEGKGKNACRVHAKILNLFNDFRYNTEKAIKTTQIIKRFL